MQFLLLRLLCLKITKKVSFLQHKFKMRDGVHETLLAFSQLKKWILIWISSWILKYVKKIGWIVLSVFGVFSLSPLWVKVSRNFHEISCKVWVLRDSAFISVANFKVCYLWRTENIWKPVIWRTKRQLRLCAKAFHKCQYWQYCNIFATNIFFLSDITKPFC